MSKAKKSPETKSDDQLHRLTDISTEEVSMVDRAANKRKWIVTKNETGERVKMFETIDKNGETDMTKIAKGEAAAVSTETVIELLTGLTTALETLSTVTETVKNYTTDVSAKIEKGEAVTQPAIKEWGTDLTGVTKSLESLFTICPALAPAAVTKTAEEIAAAKAVDDAAKLEAEKAATKKAEDDAAKTAADKAAEEKKAQDDKTAKAAEFVKSLGMIVSDLTAAKAAPTVASLTEITKKMDSVYVSGGLMIDTYDIAALEKLCEAINMVIANGGEQDMAKSAPLTLAEAASRVAGIAKKLETTAVTQQDGKDLKVVELLIKHVVKKLTPPTVATTEPVKDAVTKSDITSLEAKMATLVSDAVTKAVGTLNTEITTLKNENTALATKLAKALTDGTATRASSGEPGSNGSGDESKLFPLNYNADKQK